MAFVVGIDSTGYCDAGCVVLGSESQINALYFKFDRILREAGHTGEVHWRRVRKGVRKKACEGLTKAIKESAVVFIVLSHTKPRDWRKSDFLGLLAAGYAKELGKRLKPTEEHVFVRCDKDFDKLWAEGTKKFLFLLLTGLAASFTSKEVAPEHKRDYSLYLDLPSGKKLHIVGQVADRSHNEICVADIVLGLSKACPRLDRVLKRKMI